MRVDSKVMMVTGATSGIGEAAAESLARLGASVVLVGRDRERTKSVADRIRQDTGNRSVGYLTADLSSQRSVRELARGFASRYPRLDVLINNAGGIFMRRRLSEDGIEMTFALNHLGYFLLTNLLLDMLISSAPARVVNVSSCGHELAGGLDLSDLQRERGYRGFPAYHQSKLANLLFTYELARRLSGTGVTVNALHPGLVATRIGLNNGLGWRLIKPLISWAYGIRYVSPEVGAQTLTYLATSLEVEGQSGGYYVSNKAAASSPASRDGAAALSLWELSERMTELDCAVRT
ncbi:MAG: SDR family oxidoreductase [Isosphaeraceae bacterium]